MPLERSADRLRRILVLVPWLIANPGASIDDLCERFAVSRAELSADLDLLFLCGLPPFGPGDLIDVSIEGDAVTIRMADYLTRPPRLTREEATALLVMGRALLSLPDFEAAPSLERALDKLARAMAPQDADGAHDTAARVAVELAGAGAEHLAAVRAAIEERERIHITYYTAGRDAMSERDIDPLLAFGMLGQWYCAAFDHANQEERVFRVDRIKDLARTGVTFEVPHDFDAASYTTAQVFTPSSTDLVCEIEIAPAAGWVAEVVPFDSEEQAKNGWRRLRLRTPHLAWLIRLLLAVGPNARAVAPPELVAGLREAADRALERYT